MDQTTSYNLAINELKQQKLLLDKEIADLLNKRDIIYNEISDQRNGKGIVQQEKVVLEEKKYSIMEQLEIIKETLRENRNNFLNTTEKEKNYIESLERTIEEKTELEKKFLIKESELGELLKEIEFKQTSLKSLMIDLDKSRKEIEQHRSEQIHSNSILSTREKDIKEKEKYLLNTQIALDKRSDELDIKEERLNEWSIELKEEEKNTTNQ